MKNLIDVLKQKEADLERLQKEIEVLRTAVGLLADEGDPHLEVLHSNPPTGEARKEATTGKRQFP